MEHTEENIQDLPDMPAGHAGTEEDKKKNVIRIGRKEVFMFLGGTVLAVAIGSYAWHASKYYFQDKKYRSMADKAVEGVHALNDLAQTVDESDIAMSS